MLSFWKIRDISMQAETTPVTDERFIWMQEVHWVYGFSNTITNGVTDLRTEMHSHTVGYIAGTVVVLFDIWSHTQVQIIVSVDEDRSVAFQLVAQLLAQTRTLSWPRLDSATTVSNDRKFFKVTSTRSSALRPLLTNVCCFLLTVALRLLS